MILKLFMKTLILLMIFLFLLTVTGCGQGWSVGGVVLTPQDTVTNTVFIELMGADSSLHYYHNRIYQTQNWCWIHHQFEDVNYE